LFVRSLDRWIAQDFDNLELKLKELDAAEAEAEAAEKAAKGESTVLEEVCIALASIYLLVRVPPRLSPLFHTSFISCGTSAIICVVSRTAVPACAPPPPFLFLHARRQAARGGEGY
jgi:hypothetical protein